MPSNERRKEIKRRRHRRKKMSQLTRQLQSAKVSEKSVIAEKIRRLSPGAEDLLKNLGLEEPQ